MKFVWIVPIVSLSAGVAAACPVCDSSTAAEVRAGLAADASAGTALAIAAPFAVVAGVASLVHFGVPGRRGRR